MRDVHAAVHAVKHGGAVERAMALVAEKELCALLDSLVDLRLNALRGLLADERAHRGLRIHRVADLDGLDLCEQLFDELVVYTAVDDEALGHGADLTGHVEGAAGGCFVDSVVDVRVCADYHRRVAAKLKALIFQVAAAVFGDALAGGGAAGEVHARNAVIRGEPLADAFAAAGDALVSVAGEARLIHKLREQQHGERVVARRLDDAAVAAEQSWGDFLCKQSQGRVEWNYADDGSDRLADGDVKVVLHAGLHAEGYRRAAEVVARGGDESFDMRLEAAEVVIGLLVGLADFLALDKGEALVGLLLHEEVDKFLHHGHALMKRNLAPFLFALDGIGYRVVHVLLGSGRYGVDDLVRRRVDDLDYLAVRRIDGLAVNEHLHPLVLLF